MNKRLKSSWHRVCVNQCLLMWACFLQQACKLWFCVIGRLKVLLISIHFYGECITSFAIIKVSVFWNAANSEVNLPFGVKFNCGAKWSLRTTTFVNVKGKVRWLHFMTFSFMTTEKVKWKWRKIGQMCLFNKSLNDCDNFFFWLVALVAIQSH